MLFNVDAQLLVCAATFLLEIFGALPGGGKAMSGLSPRPFKRLCMMAGWNGEHDIPDAVNIRDKFSTPEGCRMTAVESKRASVQSVSTPVRRLRVLGEDASSKDAVETPPSSNKCTIDSENGVQTSAATAAGDSSVMQTGGNDNQSGTRRCGEPDVSDDEQPLDLVSLPETEDSLDADTLPMGP